MTIEELAIISQRDYESIRNEMATRSELKSLENAILRSIEGIRLQWSVYNSRWSAEFDRIGDRISDIEGRMDVFHPP